MSNDPEQEYFSDGMTDDIITDLSKISGLFVIARNSAFTYKGQMEKALQINPQLSLEGARRTLPYKNPAVLERILVGFRKAGLE